MTDELLNAVAKTARRLRGGNPGELAQLLTFPEHVGDGLVLRDIARRVAEDQHPGDDVFGPRALLTSALEGVRLDKLRKLARQAGGPLLVTGELARSCCDMYDDGLCGWVAHALTDAGVEGYYTGLSPEDSALVLVSGVVMYFAEAARV